MDEYEPEISSEELARMTSLMGVAPQTEDKQNQFTFVNNVVEAEDTTRVGNVTMEELGNAKYPIRSYKDAALISKEIMENDFFSQYFEKESEIVTSTSLSKDGFLDRLAVTQKREIADVTKRRKKNKGWFTKKEEPEPSYNESGGYTTG